MKILLATDGEQPSVGARRLIAKLGRRGPNEVTVMAVSGFAMSLEEGARAERRYSPEAGRKRAHEIVGRAVQELRAEGCRATDRVGEGYPPFEILHEIERESYDLTVLGAGSSTWLGQTLLGSVSTKVLHASPTSVLIVHHAQDTKAGKVLLGTDGSGDSELAMRAVADFADPERAAIEVVSVSRRGERTDEAPRSGHAEQAAENAEHALKEAGFEVVAEVVEGKPAEQLLERAGDCDFDLVAVGSRGRGRLERVVLGSVSDRVARHAPAALVGRGR